MNSLDSLQIIRNIANNYNSIAKHFSVTRNMAWPEFGFFKKYIKDGQNILDWGCGNGRLLDFLKDFDIKYYGIDISKELIKIGEEKYKDKVKDGRAFFFSTDKEDKKFAENFFDVAFMIASLNHLPSKESRLQVLKQVFSEIKKGGKLMITVWNLDSTWFQKKKEYEKIGEGDYLVHWKDKDSKTQVKLYYHNFSKKELNDLLTQVGFKVKICEYYDNDFIDDKSKARNLVALAEQ